MVRGWPRQTPRGGNIGRGTNEERAFRLTRVSSSNVQSVGERDGDLYVRFKGGGYYKYLGQGLEADKIVRASSAGKALNRLVKEPGAPFIRLRKGG